MIAKASPSADQSSNDFSTNRGILSRRSVVIGLGSSATMLALPHRVAHAGIFGDTPMTAQGFLTGIVNVLKVGWNTADLIANLDKDAGDLGDTIKHMDAVLTQVQSTLKTIQTFVQDCDDALHKIEDALKRLPAELSDAFNATAANEKLGLINGQCANLAAAMQSTGSIHKNADYITGLCRQMVEAISEYSVHEKNVIQFTMQAVPALTTWVHGYTVANALLRPNQRDINPWDHPVVLNALPRLQDCIAKLQSEQAIVNQIELHLINKLGVVYQYNEAKNEFNATSIPFKWIYQSGEIDTGHYYCICSAPMPSWFDKSYFRKLYSDSAPPYRSDPPMYWDASELDRFLSYPDYNVPISYLVQDNDKLGYRYWSGGPWLRNNDVENWLENDPKAADARAYDAMLRPIRTNYFRVSTFHQLADGLDAFVETVRTQLVQGNRDKWNSMPVIPTPT